MRMAKVAYAELAGKPMQLRQAVAEPQTRMVFHEGTIELRSTLPNATIDSSIKLGESLGGYVESRTDASVVLRIPVKLFRPNFDRFVALGSLISKRLHSDDITDQFTETELRLRVARASLERLQVLLGESRDAEEKIRLLRDIQRLSQQIDLDEAQKKELAQKASYSRLTINVQPFFFAGESTEPIGAFQWITLLNPIRTQELLQGRGEKLTPPTGYIDLELHHCDSAWVAAGSDGSEIWTRRIINNPQGDAMFWIEALRLRLGKTFAHSSISTIGAWQVLTMVSHDDAPYTWLLGVRIQSGELILVEAFFPNQFAYNTHIAAVTTTLQGAQQ